MSVCFFVFEIGSHYATHDNKTDGKNYNFMNVLENKLLMQ
jgi:hypothetical protein